MSKLYKASLMIAGTAFVVAGCMVDGIYFKQCIEVIIVSGMYIATSALVLSR